MEKNNPRRLAEQQFHWLQKLNRIALAPIMISHAQQDGITPSIRFYAREHNWRYPFQYRRCMDNELFFDVDVKDWGMVRMYAKPLIKALKKLKLNFIMAGSGGKGIHLHLWVKAIDYQKSFGFREVREALWNYILDDADIDMGLRGAGQPYCNATLLFSDQSEYGKVMREFGGTKNNNLKTLVTRIPRKREFMYRKECVFPDEVPIWDVPIDVLQSLELKGRHPKRPLHCGVCPIDSDFLYTQSHYNNDWGDLRVKRNACTKCEGKGIKDVE